MTDAPETPRPNRSPTIADLAARMTEAMKLVKNPEPKGYNSFHKYSFVSIGQVTQMCRTALAEAGIAFLPTVLDTVENVDGKNHSVVVTLEAVFVAAESGEWMATRWVALGKDTSDKAFNKAYTAAIKQCLVKTFLIADEVDPDEESPDPPAKPSHAQAYSPKKPKGPPEEWRKANARFWAATKELDDSTQKALHDAFKRMAKVESSKDLAPDAIHKFVDKLESAESIATAADIMISKFSGEPDTVPDDIPF